MIDVIVSKRCTHCGEVKPLQLYDRNEAATDGYQCRCKRCRSARAKERYAARKADGRPRSRNVPRRVEPLWPLPTHDYTPADIAWRSVRMPVFSELGARI